MALQANLHVGQALLNGTPERLMCHLGGTFALYARLARCCKLPTPTATEQEFDTNLTRYGTKLEKGAKASVGNYVRLLRLKLRLPPSSETLVICSILPECA